MAQIFIRVDVKQLNYVPLNRYNEGFIIDLVALEVIKSFVSEFTFTQGTLLTK